MLENLSKEELKDLIECYNDYIIEWNEEHDEGEPVSIYEYYDNEYQNWFCTECGKKKEDYEGMYCDTCYNEHFKAIESIKGISVRDIEGGIKFVVVGTENVLGTYDIMINTKNFSEMDLFNICQVVSTKINNMYYEKRELPTQEEIVSLVREELVK